MPSLRVHALIACAITVALALAFALLASDVVRLYFPYAEEWKILRPSLPWTSHPVEWFRGFAGTMREPYPAWSVAAINFLRPVMNLVYWLRGALFGDNWGAHLYFNFPLVAAAAGALYFTLRAPAGAAAGPWLSGVLVGGFVLMPPMFSAATFFLPVLIPQMPFDALITALYLLACAAYAYRRYAAAALLTFAALMTKEQAVTLAAALPLVYAWHHRRQWREAWATLLLLLLPLLVWLAMRLLLFGSVSQGVYVLLREPADIIRATLSNLLRMPLHAPTLGSLVRDPLSWQALLVACNLVVLAYLVIDMSRRWRLAGPDLVSVVFVFGWGFLALVGFNPRYGGIIIAPAIWMLARPAAVGIPPVTRVIALSALIATGIVHGALSWQAYGPYVRFSAMIYDVGREYAAALEDAGDGTVIVLNDPNTPWTAPADLAAVLGLPGDVHKASDFPWHWPPRYARSIPEQPCEVTVSAVGDGRIEMFQSCGFLIMGASVPRETPLFLPVTGGVRAEFPEPTFGTGDRGVRVGTRLVLHVERPDVSVLYFDPSSRSLHRVDP